MAGEQQGQTPLPVQDIEQIVGVSGHVSNSVLALKIPRGDIGNVQGPRNVTLPPDLVRALPRRRSRRSSSSC